MARDFARIFLNLAYDTDFEELAVDAQWLYLRVFTPDPTLSWVGVADWRPPRLTNKAHDITLDRLIAAATELERHRFVLFDLGTEELLIRSYVRREELLRNPKMAICVIKEFRRIASRSLRAAVVTELRRIHREHPEYSCWTYNGTAGQLAELVAMPGLDTIGYTNQYTAPAEVVDPGHSTSILGEDGPIGDPDPDGVTDRRSSSITDAASTPDANTITIEDRRMITDAIGNPESKTDNASEPNCIGIRNPIDNADRIGAIGSVPLAIDNADSASDADPRSDSATIPRQQTTFNEQHQEGYVSREPHQSATLGREPPQRCPVHADDPHPPPCNGCAEARRTHNAWQRANTEALKAEAAQLRIAGRTCSMCDGRWRYPPPELLAVNPDPPVVKCDHVTPTTLDHWHLSEDTPRDPSRPHRATTGP